MVAVLRPLDDDLARATSPAKSPASRQAATAASDGRGELGGSHRSIVVATGQCIWPTARAAMPTLGAFGRRSASDRGRHLRVSPQDAGPCPEQLVATTESRPPPARRLASRARPAHRRPRREQAPSGTSRRQLDAARRLVRQQARPARQPGKQKSIVNQKQRPWGLIITTIVVVLFAGGDHRLRGDPARGSNAAPRTTRASDAVRPQRDRRREGDHGRDLQERAEPQPRHRPGHLRHQSRRSAATTASTGPTAPARSTRSRSRTRTPCTCSSTARCGSPTNPDLPAADVAAAGQAGHRGRPDGDEPVRRSEDADLAAVLGLPAVRRLRRPTRASSEFINDAAVQPEDDPGALGDLLATRRSSEHPSTFGEHRPSDALRRAGHEAEHEPQLGGAAFRCAATSCG